MTCPTSYSAPKSKVSHCLPASGLVQGEIDGPRVCYCIAPAALRRLRVLIAEL